MAVQRQPKANCTEHTIEINNLKKDMERIKDHEIKFNSTIQRIEEKVDLLSDTTLNINATLLHFKDFPDRIRKLEDKAIIYDLVKVGLGILFGVIINNYIQNTFVATTKEEKKYEIEKHK